MQEQQYQVPVWPRPQEVRFGAGQVELTLPLPLGVQGSEPWLSAAARQAAQGINRATGRRIVATSGKARGKEGLTVTTMAGLPGGLRPVNADEGYVLSIASQGIVLAGHDARGISHGAQTLAQFLRASDGASLSCVVVRDWPRFPIRGVHVYLPPREQFRFFFRLLDFLAELKLNTLVLEIGGGMEYQKHPEINRAWAKFCRDARAYDFDTDTSPSRCSDKAFASKGRHERTGPNALESSRYFWKDSTHTELAGGTWLTKDECRQIKAECDRRHIEIVPEVQSLSHAYYLCYGHPEIAERADDPWPDTYCPSNPKSYELLFDVMDEVIEVFQPRIMHIGHDEAYTFRICPKCRKRTGYDILAGDINKIHAFLAGRGVRPLMWGDKLMNMKRDAGGAMVMKDPATGKKSYMPATYKAVDMVPKDLLICDWYWEYDPKSERYFHERGFEVVYGNIHPLAFDDFEQRADCPGILGGETSSWCEVSPYAFGHNATLYNFFPTADMLWRGLQMERRQVCALMAPWMTRVVEDLTEQDRWLVSGGKGESQPLDLSPAARPLPESLAGKMETGVTLQTVLGTGSFTLLTSEGVLERAVVLDREHPKAAPLPVGGKASRLLLLQGMTLEDVYYKPTYSSYHRGPADVLRCRVKYADGGLETFSAFYGEDIGQTVGDWPTPRVYWWYPSSCYRAVPVAAGPDHTLYAREWVNPRPEVAIASVTFSLGPDATDEGEVLVAAVTAVQ